MRVSTQMMYQQNMRGIANSQAEWMKFGEQMSTGRHVVNPSDGPIATSQAVILSQAQAQNSQYTLACSFAMRKVPLEENVLSQVTTTIQAAQEEIVYVGSGTLDGDDRVSLATDPQGIRDQLMNPANSTNGSGRYTFGGYKTESTPFTQTDGVYSGDTTSVTQQVDVSRTMVIGHIDDKILANLTDDTVSEPGGDTQEKNLFKVLGAAVDTLKTPIAGDDVVEATAAAAIDKTNRGLRNSLSNALSIRAGLGAQLSKLSSLDSLGVDRALGQTQQMSNLMDVDWDAAISSYITQQTALQTSYRAFTNMQGISLFQLNR